jgi:hypothetical protein
LLAIVIDLGKNAAVVLVYVIGNFFKPVYHLGIIDIDKLIIGHIRGMNTHLLGDDQSGTPFGPFSPVVHLALAGQIIDRKIGQMGLKGDPVFNLYMSQGNG